MSTASLLADALEPITSDPARAAVLLDVDGTLAPIVRHADDAVVPEQTRQLLIPLSRAYALVACVSGRRAADARRMVALGNVTYVGGHGTELLRAGWTEPHVDPALEDWTRRVRDFTRDAERRELRALRVRTEDKGAIVAFHWRGSPDEGAARAAVDAVARQAEEAGLRTHWGRKVLEVRPPVRIDKGAGIQALLADAGLEAALYAGDDRTDLDAFRGLAELRDQGLLGRIVRVAVHSEEGPSELAGEADLEVEGTEGVRALLEALRPAS
ncbi:MAG: trehalose-phosphatase [Solirubrobacteraceae bacterium]